jgi:hypothetical protein
MENGCCVMPMVPLGMALACDVILAEKVGGNKWKMAVRYAEGDCRHRRDGVTSKSVRTRAGLPPCRYADGHVYAEGDRRHRVSYTDGTRTARGVSRG